MKKRGVYRILNNNSSSSARRGQVGAEFLIIMAFILIILLSIIALNQGLLDSLTGQMRGERGRIVVNDLADAAESVYLQGVGAQTRILISVPSGVKFSQVTNRTLRLGLEDRSGHQNDIYRNTDFIVNGFIPTEEGNHWITVRAMPGYVLIGYGLIEVSPSGIARVLSPSNSSLDTVFFRNVVGEDVDVALVVEIDADINTYLSTPGFMLAAGQNTTALLNLSVPSSTAPGLYTGRLMIQANTSEESQIIYLPITVSVVYGNCETDCCPLIQLFPAVWNLGMVGINKLYTGLFFVCSNFNTTQSVNLTFSNYSNVGFDRGINQKTRSLAVSPGNCSTTYVYVNTTNAPEREYTPLLLASASGAFDSSQIIFNLNYSGDQLPPIVNLMWPPNNYMVNSTNLIFKYNVSDLNSSIAYCNLILDGTVVAVNATITEDIEQSFSYSWLSAGVYNWTVGCADDSPNANYGTAEPRLLRVNTSVICISPNLVYEEDFDPQWTTELAYIGDSSYAIPYDEGSDPLHHYDYPPADSVYMEFPSMGISSSYSIGSAILYVRHQDFPLDGTFNESDRHEISCFNGRNWMVMDNYNISEGHWTYYVSPEMGSCISTAEVANNIYLQMTFDPADYYGGYQYLDFAKVCVNLTDGHYVFLWPMAVDNQRIVDFTSGLNTTANTFGLNGSWSDGWDWQEGIYGGNETDVSVFNVDQNADGDISDSNVSNNKYIEVAVGGRPGGSAHNPQDGKILGPVASAGYGVKFNLTNELFLLVNNSGKRAYVTFDYTTNENPWDEDTKMEDGDEGWVKARLTTQNETVWLGWDLDDYPNSNYHRDADPYKEIWFASDPYDDTGRAIIDVTSYFTYSGYYYLDMGVALGDWNFVKEGFACRFDNVAIVIR